jgi:Skp family chaperone for outer membrane proteins
MTENATARKATLWVILVFLLGAGLGTMAGFVYAHHKFAVTNAASAWPVSDAARRAVKVQELSNTANLSPEQTQQVDGIVADIQSKIKAIRKTTDPQVDEVRKAGQDRIRAILTPQQLPKYEQFIQKLAEDRKRAGQ